MKQIFLFILTYSRVNKLSYTSDMINQKRNKIFGTILWVPKVSRSPGSYQQKEHIWLIIEYYILGTSKIQLPRWMWNFFLCFIHPGMTSKGNCIALILWEFFLELGLLPRRERGNTGNMKLSKSFRIRPGLEPGSPGYPLSALSLCLRASVVGLGSTMVVHLDCSQEVRVRFSVGSENFCPILYYR
jgi:hypothetical protein